jgi:hypothetical protein
MDWNNHTEYGAHEPARWSMVAIVMAILALAGLLMVAISLALAR